MFHLLQQDKAEHDYERRRFLGCVEEKVLQPHKSHSFFALATTHPTRSAVQSTIPYASSVCELSTYLDSNRKVNSMSSDLVIPQKIL